MEQVRYILSDNNINKEFIYPYLNIYNFNIFKQIVIINVNDVLWIRLDDVEKYLNKYITNITEYTISMNSNNIKYLNQLHDVPFWDTDTDIYIHESEFILLALASNVISFDELKYTFDYIRYRRNNRMFNNALLRYNLSGYIKSQYNYDINCLDTNNYIITVYNNIFTIKCVETCSRMIFLLL